MYTKYTYSYNGVYLIFVYVLYIVCKFYWTSYVMKLLLQIQSKDKITIFSSLKLCRSNFIRLVFSGLVNFDCYMLAIMVAYIATQLRRYRINVLWLSCRLFSESFIIKLILLMWSFKNSNHYCHRHVDVQAMSINILAQ